MNLAARTGFAISLMRLTSVASQSLWMSFTTTSVILQATCGNLMAGPLLQIKVEFISTMTGAVRPPGVIRVSIMGEEKSGNISVITQSVGCNNGLPMDFVGIQLALYVMWRTRIMIRLMTFPTAGVFVNGSIPRFKAPNRGRFPLPKTWKIMSGLQNRRGPEAQGSTRNGEPVLSPHFAITSFLQMTLLVIWTRWLQCFPSGSIQMHFSVSFSLNRMMQTQMVHTVCLKWSPQIMDGVGGPRNDLRWGLLLCSQHRAFRCCLWDKNFWQQTGSTIIKCWIGRMLGSLLASPNSIVISSICAEIGSIIHAAYVRKMWMCFTSTILTNS